MRQTIEDMAELGKEFEENVYLYTKERGGGYASSDGRGRRSFSDKYWYALVNLNQTPSDPRKA